MTDEKARLRPLEREVRELRQTVKAVNDEYEDANTIEPMCRIPLNALCGYYTLFAVRTFGTDGRVN